MTKVLVSDCFLNYQPLIFTSGGKPLQHCCFKRATLATECNFRKSFNRFSYCISLYMCFEFFIRPIPIEWQQLNTEWLVTTFQLKEGLSRIKPILVKIAQLFNYFKCSNWNSVLTQIQLTIIKTIYFMCLSTYSLITKTKHNLPFARSGYAVECGSDRSSSSSFEEKIYPRS